MRQVWIWSLASICWLGMALAAATTRGENWPQWRGPQGDSTSPSKLPITWSAEQGLAWKAALPAWGTSTPIVWNGAIFVTTQEDERLMVLRLRMADGAVVWQREVGAAPVPRNLPGRERQKFHRLHNLASPSPVTDGRIVVVHFGNGDLAAFDFDGKALWQRNLQEHYGTYTIWWGHANSPVIVDDLVISVCMQDSLADLRDERAASYLVAHDLETGAERWNSMRMTDAPGEQGDSYTTPIVVNIDGQRQLVVMGSNQLDGYDPATGRQLWFLPGLVGGRTVTGPTYANGLIYVTHGMRGPLLAIRPGGRGELQSDRIVWRYEKGTPDTPCPVVEREILFTVSDDGIARAFDAASGKLHWTERLGGDYKASPLAANGRVYFLNTSGVCTVVAAHDRFEKLAENILEDETLASPAAAAGRLLLRGRGTLYCIGTGEHRGE